MENITKIYTDFDGTITKYDAVNRFFELYADKKWEEYEALWVDGKISSRENAIKQVALIRPMDKSVLENYINNIEIDETFLDFYKEINARGIELVILSDGFDLFIKEALRRLGIENVKFFANHLIFKDNKFSIEFPYYTDKCLKKSGNCKCAQIKEKDFVYIGDGTSDLCVAKKAKILFASKYLDKYCYNHNINHISFNSFGDILENIKNENYKNL